jgi:15-cis-phytoene synthase
LSTEAQQITKASRSNLALAFIALPRQRREDISTFYAFCRVVDDIVDDPGASRSQRETDLLAWKTALSTPQPGEPTLAAPVREIIARYSLPVEHFHEIIAGMEMDLDAARYGTWEGLRLYCHRVASVVGLVSIAIFGAAHPLSKEYALNLGLALQITNILRDVGADLANEGRIYLPEEDLAQFGVSREDLAAHRRTERFLALMDFEAERARGFFKAALAAIHPSDRKALAAAEIMRAVYSRLLEKMAKDRWQVFDRRYSLNKLTKIYLIVRQLIF